MIRGELDGRQYCLVAKKIVSRLIWEDAERVYFCFDLMLMLRTMIDECPQLAPDGPVAIGEGGK